LHSARVAPCRDVAAVRFRIRHAFLSSSCLSHAGDIYFFSGTSEIARSAEWRCQIPNPQEVFVGAGRRRVRGRGRQGVTGEASWMESGRVLHGRSDVAALHHGTMHRWLD
jgi:hypothetical protein